MSRGRWMSVPNRSKITASIIRAYDTQRKVFTTPVRNEADDESVTEIVPKVRDLNRKRGCAAVSIGEKCHQSILTFMVKRFSN